MPDEPVRIDVSWADDRYPLVPDERPIARIRLHRVENPIWPEEYEEGFADDDLVDDYDGDDPAREARLEEERDTIAALSDELRELRQGDQIDD